MPKKCANCRGTISKDEDIEHCCECNVPYHRDCMPDICVRCKKDT
jgi:hypothetical protein